jgi:hypothetical protein
VYYLYQIVMKKTEQLPKKRSTQPFGYIKEKRPQGVGINAIAKEAGV